MTAPRRTTATLLATAALGLALAGCSTDSDDQDAASSPAPASADSSAGGDAGSAQPSTDEAYTVEHTDDFKTIVTFTPAQIEGLTGQSMSGADSASIDAAALVFADPATWSEYEETAGYADLIAEAAERESDRITRVLTVESEGGDLGLRLYIGHNEHVHEAHFNPND